MKSKSPEHATSNKGWQFSLSLSIHARILSIKFEASCKSCKARQKRYEEIGCSNQSLEGVCTAVGRLTTRG